jgi:hypothetical protein
VHTLATLEGETMGGTVTKRHFFQIWRTFGIQKALRVLFTRQRSALTILMS